MSRKKITVEEKAITIRMPPGVHAGLEKKAAEDRRSLNAEACWIFEAYAKGELLSADDWMKLIRGESARAGSAETSSAVTGVGGKEIWLGGPAGESHTTGEHQAESRKKTRRGRPT